jgi:hypothetical protein
VTGIPNVRLGTEVLISHHIFNISSLFVQLLHSTVGTDLKKIWDNLYTKYETSAALVKQNMTQE